MKRSLQVLAAASVFAAPLVHQLVTGSLVQAQSAPAAAFDVTSVKRNNGNTPGMQMRIGPGLVSGTNVPVRQLLRQAYQVQDFQIVGGPEWMGSDRFDIEARFDPAPLPGMAPPARLQAMLASLLTDRFKLATHRETRELPIFALVLARNDRRLGPQLKPSAVDCEALRRGGPPPDAGRGGPPGDGRRGAGPGPDGRGAPPPPGTPFSLGERPVCGGRGGFGQLIAGGQTMAQFATQMSQQTGRVVLDRTGLTGGYDLDLKWTPTPDQLPQGPLPPGFEPPPIDPNGPSLYTALEEQLGLKLDAQRGPVEVLVVDRLEPPTED